MEGMLRAGELVETYGDMLFRLCLVMLKNRADAEDAVQNTFLKYIRKPPSLEGPEHEKAWLIRVAANECRDMLRYGARHSHMDIDILQDMVSLGDTASQNDISESRDIVRALMDVPEKFRIVLILHYAEGYTTGEIAHIIGRSASAVKMRLKKGRELLEEIYRKEYM